MTELYIERGLREGDGGPAFAVVAWPNGERLPMIVFSSSAEAVEPQATKTIQDIPLEPPITAADIPY